MDSLLKLRICEKKRLPYSEDENHTYYDPRCIKGMYSCIDVCGQRCQERCQDDSHPAECGRGKLPGDFMSCPSREEHTASLEYISYGLVEDLHIKEGKKTYKKMEQIRSDVSLEEFHNKFFADFEAYAEHKVVAWHLNNLKVYASTASTQNPQNMVCISDFAQNLKLSKKQETSEEYFHKTQVALFATVTTVKSESQQHTLSQITSSDVK